MSKSYTEAYFTWKGVHAEMCMLKANYAKAGLQVPKDTWWQLEAICKVALDKMKQDK